MKGVEMKLWLTRDREGISVFEGSKPTYIGGKDLAQWQEELSQTFTDTSRRGCHFLLGVDSKFFKKEFGFLPDMNSCDRCELIIKRKDGK